MFSPWAACMAAPCKLINPKNPGERGKSDPGHWELYHLDNDPSEATDLSDRHPDRVDQLKRALADWEKALPKNRWGQFGKQDRNYFDSFTFNKAAGGSWFDPDAWHETGEDTQLARMSCQDLYPNAVLIFPLTANGCKATNNLYSASGLSALLNRLDFTGKGEVTLTGNPLRFVSSLSATPPQIVVPAGAHATIDLALQADAPLTVSGGGSLTLSGGLSAPEVRVGNGIFRLECDAQTDLFQLKSTTLELRSKQVVGGELALGLGVHLSVEFERPPAQKTLVLEADEITGAFANTSLKMNGRDYRIHVDGGAVFIAP